MGAVPGRSTRSLGSLRKDIVTSPPKFTDVLVDRKHRFSIGVEECSGRHYLSIPVSNSLVDYEEYYEIDAASFERYKTDRPAAVQFAEQCRARAVDDRLFMQPGKDRGVPR